MKRLYYLSRMAGCALVIALVALPVCFGADSLVWRARQNSVDADVEKWSFEEMLGNLSKQTGWQIFVEPGTDPVVSTRFKNLSPREALGRLLRDLSYALLQQTNGAPKLFINRSTIQEATRTIAPRKDVAKSDDAEAVANELILTMKPGSKEAAEALAAKLGGKVSGALDAAGLYRLKFDDAAAAAAARGSLQADGSVASVDSNYVIEQPPVAESLSLSSGVPNSLKADLASNSNRVVVGLVDTRVQRAGTRLGDFLLDGVNITGNDAGVSSDLTHGTSMAETILQGVAMAKGGSTPVRILPVDVYGGSESTSTFDVAQGIVAAIKGGATIINLSLGTSGDSEFLHLLIETYSKQGVAFIGAAGNEPTTEATFPAAYSEVLAVTAGDKAGNLSSYANHGDFVDVVAPGASVVSYGGEAYLGVGNSFSTAYVSGIAAGLVAQAKLTPVQAMSRIRQTLPFKGK